MKEFEQLQGRQERLTHIIGQRRELVERLNVSLGRAEVPESLRQARQLGVRNRVIRSIEERLQPVLVETQHKIDEFLPSLATDYLAEVQRAERDLRQVVIATRRGHLNLPPDALVHYQRDVQRLRQKPSIDPLLARALELRQRQQPEQPELKPTTETKVELSKPAEENILPEIIFNEKEQTLQIDNGPIINLGKIESALVAFLYNHPNQEIPSRELAQVVKEAGSEAKTNKISEHLRSIEKRLGRPIVQRSGHTWTTKWSLPRAGQPEKTPEPALTKPADLKRKQFLEQPTFPTRLEALNAFIDNPEIAAAKIIEILGPSEKTNKPLTPDQARWAFTSAVSKLAHRNKHGLLTAEESSLWNRMKDYLKLTEDSEVAETFNNLIKVWCQQQKKAIISPEVTPKPVEKTCRKEVLEIFSDEELAILAALVTLRHNTVVRPETGKSFLFTIDDESIPLACQNLVSQIPASNLENLGTQRENYIRHRVTVIEKLGRVLESGEVEKIVDSQKNDDAKTLFIWLYFKNLEQMQGLISQFLKQSPEQVWQVERNEVTGVWKEWRANSQKAVTQVRPAQPEILVAAVTTRPSVNRAERTDPDVRQKINSYLDQIDTKLAEHELSLPANQPQVTRAFPVLIDTVFKRLRENGYLTPEAGRDGKHPVYTKEEITLALYIHNRRRQTGGFQGRLITGLKQIITEIARERTPVNGQNQNSH